MKTSVWSKSKKANGLLCVIFLFMAALYGCGSRPQAEIEAADVAMKVALDAQADIYVPAEYDALRDSMAAVRADIQAQDSCFFKKYGHAKEKLTIINSQANEIARKASLKKEEIIAKDDTLLSETKALCKENEELIKNMSRREKKKIDFDKIESELVKANISMTEAQDLYSQGDYMTTFEKAKEVNTKAIDINKQLKKTKTDK